ncbi:type I toxin-antitoxin system SymE family toxin [Salmonella enterica subsp. enterica serovar Carrau]|nr:type I addiction module toxin, SymE family [Salmonella enterica subsp. enterica serovar Madelia]EHO4509968.1 type I toxin-antitoxin system SymE family toxin [Salmonella enterica subsp. enterica serovar Carrau]
MSDTQRRYKVGYVSARHINSKTCMTTYHSQPPCQHLKGDWLEEAGFETGSGVTVKISQECILLMADSNEQLCKAEQVVKGIRMYWFSGFHH